MARRWRDIRQSIEYAAVRGALSLSARAPLAAGRRVGAVFGWAAFDLARLRRDTSIANVAASLGISSRQATTIARASYQNLGRCLLEYAAFARLTRAEVVQLTEFEGLEHLEAAVARGQGGILVAAHLGNWELMGAGIAARGFPIHFLVGEQTNGRVDDVMNDLRRRQGIGIISRSVALRKVMQALADNQLVAILTDQDARKGGVVVDFLGRPAATVRGPAVFVIRRGSPIVPCFIWREGSRHRAVVEPPMYPLPIDDEDEAIRELTQRYTDRITARVREHPDEYFWPHRRWKTTGA
jgi:Kdo2-lipid IVA lauroyltransferase/acyltransferase